jgi:predicted membrane protein (TIGR00267 family)
MPRLAYLLHLTRANVIACRYFVVNGFDGALTMLGILMGFYVSGEGSLVGIISACVGAAVALAMSGVSSAYISETAERQRELQALESAMIADLGESVHGRANQVVPAVIAIVNGLAPLLISLVIISPLWLSRYTPDWFPVPALEACLVVAMAVIFLLGVFLGRISGTFWLLAGARTLLVALATGGIIYWITG